MKNNISRRHMIKTSSIVGLSGMVLPSVSKAVVESPLTNSKENNIEIPGSDNEICYMSAIDMAALLRTKKISAREVMQAHLRQITKVNSKVNAIVTLVPEDQLMVQALAADESLAKGNITGSFHGLPIAVKDLA